jgi:hypothetical protein
MRRFFLEVTSLGDRPLRCSIQKHDRLTNYYLPNIEARNGYQN